MNLNIGDFHEVTAVGFGETGLSIVDRHGVERVMPIYTRGDTVQIDGEFGRFDHVEGGEILRGIAPRRVTAIEITPTNHFIDDDFHVRELKVKTATGLNLTWTLFCDGEAA